MIFNGKSAIVTGGANGIGLAISKGIAAAGGSVWIFDLASENPWWWPSPLEPRPDSGCDRPAVAGKCF